MKMLSALVGLCILAAALAQRNAYICEVMFENFCPTNAATCANDPALHINGNSLGFSHFNLVSFGNLYVPSGDVQGRMAIRGNANMKAFSVGYELATGGVVTNEVSLPYTAVIGGNAQWVGGSIHPDGSGFPYQGDKEYLFVGGSYTHDTQAPSDADRAGSCPGQVVGCLDADFDAAQAYYEDLSAAFNTLASNVQYQVEYGTISLTCNSQADAQYVFSITPALFSTITSWVNVGNSCNDKSGLIVNIIGTGSQVKFAGATQSIFSASKTLYNVVAMAANTPSVRVEVGTNGNLLAPDSNYNQPGMGVFIGQVIVANVQEMLQINLVYCAPPAPTPTPGNNNDTNPYCPGFETQCAGLDIALDGNTYSFRDFNAISFGDFIADTGDVQGRLAVQRNTIFGCGYSIGDQLSTATGQPDRHLPYSLVVGGDLNWCSGALYPNGDGNPYPGQAENMYVGGAFSTSQSDLVARRTGGACATPGCLDSTFNAAKTCYTTYSNSIAAQDDNVQKTIEWSGLSITCDDASADAYYVSLELQELQQFTYTTIGNCNFQARWFINIRGDEDVEITGASFPGVPGGTVYNIVGCGRTITVHDTALAGSFLAPCSTLNQPNGVITGKVVAGNVTASKQINRENTCPQQVTIVIPVVTQVPSIQSTFAQFTNDFLNIGDSIDNHVVIGAQPNNIYQFNANANWPAGKVLYVSVNSKSSRTEAKVTTTTSADQPSDSAASVMSMTIALFVALMALAF